MKEMIIELIILFILGSLFSYVFIGHIHAENKLQLECSYYMQRAVESNKEDKIALYQPQCSEYLSFLTN